MIDHTAATLALRNRALTLSVATTGSTTLAATTTGFTRAAGSFITDGFVVGMEILAAGFSTAANNGNGVVTSVAAGTLLVDAYTVTLGVTGYTVAARTLATEAAAAGRTISVGLPAMRAWENTALTPVAGKPYLEEDYVPATERLFTSPAASGMVEETGLYVLKWYGLSGKGISALRKSVHALKLLYTPGTKLTAGSHTVRVRADAATQTGQIIPLTGGMAVLVLPVPWLALSNNAIAA